VTEEALEEMWIIPH